MKTVGTIIVLSLFSVILMLLKLLGLTSWSWWIVSLPFWVTPLLLILAVIVAVIWKLTEPDFSKWIGKDL